jgi:3' terminal RNA ribose 2'-O-methyltransferase Hen1
MPWHGEPTTELHEARLAAVQSAVRTSAARSLVDLGCGDGDLLIALVAEPQLERILAVDACGPCLERLRARLGEAAGSPTHRRPRVALRQGSLTDVDSAMTGFDCAILVETIEHLEPRRLTLCERAVFARMRPATVVITTPNADYNPLLEVPPDRFRHPDHRFEWGRERFRRWSFGVARRHGYRMRHSDVGGSDPVYGGASQMAVFRRHPPVAEPAAAAGGA